MPDDRMRDLFEQVSQLQVTVPPAEHAIARGRRRRRRRLQASMAAWTVALAAGFGAPQAAGGLADGSGQAGDLTIGLVSRSVGSQPPAPGRLASEQPSHARPSSAQPSPARPSPAPTSSAPPSSAPPSSAPPSSAPRSSAPLSSAPPSSAPPSSPPRSSAPPSPARPSPSADAAARLSDSATPAPGPAARSSASGPVTPDGQGVTEIRSGSGSLRYLYVMAPRGAGQLLLGLNSAGRFVMTRLDGAGAPVPLHGLRPAPSGSQPVLVTDPAGGWLVAVTSARRVRGTPATRLALITVTGRSEPFGPKFARQIVASAAVSPDASRVAVALAGPGGPLRLAVLPLPGHHAAARSWRIPAGQANRVTALSWAPDGRHLSYIAGIRAGTRLVGGPVTLDTASRKAAAPAVSAWRAASPAAAAPVAPGMSAWLAATAKGGPACTPQAAAWLGSSGEFAVLEECPASGTEVLQPADPRTGAAAGSAVVVAKRAGCGHPALDPSSDGASVLISACGLHLDQHGTLARVPGGLTAAALAG